MNPKELREKEQVKYLGPLAKKSRGKRAGQRQAYKAQARRFLEANPVCQVWPMKGNRKRPSVDVHHMRGRFGSLLIDQRFWMAVSREAHDEIHRHPDAARRAGYLCPKGQWNVPVKCDCHKHEKQVCDVCQYRDNKLKD